MSGGNHNQRGCLFFGFNFKYFFRAYSVQKVKFDTETNSNMQNSMVVFIASALDWKYPFRQIWSKNENALFQLKVGT